MKHLLEIRARLEQQMEERGLLSVDLNLYTSVCNAIGMLRAFPDPLEIETSEEEQATLEPWGETYLGGVVVRNRQERPVRITVSY